MTDALIHLENVGIRYQMPTEPIATFKEFVIRFLQGRVAMRDFWALDSINLDIHPGEVMGVVGQNGAGKSTLLKVVARVLFPSRGRVIVRGKVAPLLDLYAGFHPELTGRENVFLNGAILGFNHRQMKAKYPSIVEFAELHEHIDAPMRNYSYGMWARLGFAVATDERPDVLLVDEVLAVGDESFQRKCYKRIHQFQDEGTTIVLISHNMPQVRELCTRVAWLDHGKFVDIGEPNAVVDNYLKHTT